CSTTMACPQGTLCMADGMGNQACIEGENVLLDEAHGSRSASFLSRTITPPANGRIIAAASFTVLHTNAGASTPLADCIFALTTDPTSSGTAGRVVTIWPGIGAQGFGNGTVFNEFSAIEGVPVTVHLVGRSDNDDKDVSVMRKFMSLRFVPSG